jgi:hypothetical protein
MNTKDNPTPTDPAGAEVVKAPGSSARLPNATWAAQDADTTQAERAAMHPDGLDLEWHYYHGAWSG